ncbi:MULTISPECIES: gamma-glutamyl-gamma-aminobutyrate hydrolase family protein [Trichocoleus]|uniref:Gamma-glutamyl-gamma-aminobutyrate hydrolase family protein n=1 Tax=Trichocoleus desertorum GB2-A4 TaxID=2933944 RepID=A0ABV0J520_9CYAN|nr:gamma-glutamyl-gamma-aminobutyrate hydrolase family protein [Trichocoleus sp. FACHB-46]MBD1861700.1 gamma-glutamyl-gamma-aminobutyrate hydrolase family protein [Trichocoleus sp. FACHB-46]
MLFPLPSPNSITKPPIIGITTSCKNETGHYSLFSNYIDAVRRAGGVPVLLTPGEMHQARILDFVDGLLFSGGGDIDPAEYEGSSHPSIYRVNAERDAFELGLANLALKTSIPMLGICRGLEIFMVVSGGQLVPHIPDEFGNTVIHRADQSHCAKHPVQLVPRTRLATLLHRETEINVVSWHHQAARSAPPGWRVAAQAPDGVIEALEHQHHPWAIAVQWHPELAPEDSGQQRIFKAFVQAASQPQVVALPQPASN